jgi:hypothetical protein
LGGAGSANFVANQPLILPLMGHLILSTKQELNYGGVRTISCISTSFEDTVRAYKGQAANLISTQIY